MLAHALIELVFTGMAKRRMADVVHQRERFGEIGIQLERPGHGARNLRHFKRVRQAIAEMIGKARGEDLRLRFEAAESARMDDAVAVARVIVAIGMLRLRDSGGRASGARPWRRVRACFQLILAAIC